MGRRPAIADPARVIGNVRCTARSDAELDVRSNLLLYVGRGDSFDCVILAAERQDVIRRTEAGLRLAKRVVVLSHTTLPVQTLAVFL